MTKEDGMQNIIDELREENERLRAKHTELHGRAQRAEAALADLLRCSEKLASGAAWCGGSLGRAFLAYRVEQLTAENERLRAALREALPFVAPAVSDLVLEFGDLDGTDAKTRERCERIRETLAQLQAVFNPSPPPPAPPL